MFKQWELVVNEKMIIKVTYKGTSVHLLYSKRDNLMN